MWSFAGGSCRKCPAGKSADGAVPTGSELECNHGSLFDPGAEGVLGQAESRLQAGQTLECLFSAVSKPIFASQY